MKHLVLFLILVPCLVIVGGGCTDDLPEGQQIDYEEDIKPLIEDSFANNAVVGSCNMIDTGSHCEDYIGSYWTPETMQLQCEGVGVWSPNTCPYSDNGGCRVTAGTIVDNILWSYPYGGSPITGENLYYESMACNMIEGAQWIMPDDLLETR